MKRWLWWPVLSPVLALLAGIIAVATATGAATPVSPPSGTITRSSHPVLSWMLPPGETVRDVNIARAPDTTPMGAFYDENIVTRSYGEVAPNAVSWAPKDALRAGSYWWNVETRDEDYTEYYSVASGFTIPPALAVFSARIEYFYGLGWADITVRYRTNVETLVVTATLSRLGGRRIWSGRERESFIRPGRVEETEITWRRLRGVPARRIRLTVTLTGPGVRARTSKIIRAPGFGDA